MLTIGIIDSQPVAQLGLTLKLNEGFNDPTIYAARDFSEFRAMKKDSIPNMFILGFHLNKVSLYASKIEKCLSFYPSVPLIVYGDCHTFKVVGGLLKLGSKGYISKKNDEADLIYCVNAVLQGDHFIKTSFDEEPIVHPSIRDVLSPREYRVALLLIQGLSNNGVGEKLSLKPSTVSTFKNIIFKKLNVKNIIRLREVMCPDAQPF